MKLIFAFLFLVCFFQSLAQYNPDYQPSDPHEWQQQLKKNLNPERPTPDYVNTPKKFDPSQENFDRYKNSPCANELGFIPGRDNEDLYRAYKEAKKKEQIKPVIIVMSILAGLFLIGVIGALIAIKTPPLTGNNDTI